MEVAVHRHPHPFGLTVNADFPGQLKNSCESSLCRGAHSYCTSHSPSIYHTRPAGPAGNDGVA